MFYHLRTGCFASPCKAKQTFHLQLFASKKSQSFEARQVK